jgi:hypothetical protein
MINEKGFIEKKGFIIFKKERFIKERFRILEEDIFNKFNRA